MITWHKINSEDIATIEKITDRFIQLISIHSTYQFPVKLDIAMDITAAHINSPLDLSALLTAPDFDIIHDISGIIKNLNRKTGILENCFLPYYCIRGEE